ncbi:MAG: matrixin family metalloprotease [Desulfitobacteriaceae bacterium]
MIKKRKIALLLIVVLFSLMFVQSAFAWPGIGYVWQNPGAPQLRFVSGFPSDLQTAASNAAYSWGAYPLHTYIWGNNSSGNLNCTSYYNSNSYTSGTTYPAITLGYITGANIEINTYWSNSYSTLGKQSLVGHEFGHALGLSEYYADNWGLMVHSDATRNANETFQPRTSDINGINSLYP